MAMETSKYEEYEFFFAVEWVTREGIELFKYDAEAARRRALDMLRRFVEKSLTDRSISQMLDVATAGGKELYDKLSPEERHQVIAVLSQEIH